MAAGAFLTEPVPLGTDTERAGLLAGEGVGGAEPFALPPVFI